MGGGEDRKSNCRLRGPELPGGCRHLGFPSGGPRGVGSACNWSFAAGPRGTPTRSPPPTHTRPLTRAYHHRYAQGPFLKFAEKHRRLVNALVRNEPKLLLNSFSFLLQAHRLLDFDNKCARRGRGGALAGGGLGFGVVISPSDLISAAQCCWAHAEAGRGKPPPPPAQTIPHPSTHTPMWGGCQGFSHPGVWGCRADTRLLLMPCAAGGSTSGARSSLWTAALTAAR